MTRLIPEEVVVPEIKLEVENAEGSSFLHKIQMAVVNYMVLVYLITEIAALSTSPGEGPSWKKARDIANGISDLAIGSIVELATDETGMDPLIYELNFTMGCDDRPPDSFYDAMVEEVADQYCAMSEHIETEEEELSLRKYSTWLLGHKYLNKGGPVMGVIPYLMPDLNEYIKDSDFPSEPFELVIPVGLLNNELIHSFAAAAITDLPNYEEEYGKGGDFDVPRFLEDQDMAGLFEYDDQDNLVFRYTQEDVDNVARIMSAVSN